MMDDEVYTRTADHAVAITSPTRSLVWRPPGKVKHHLIQGRAPPVSLERNGGGRPFQTQPRDLNMKGC